MKDLEMLPKNSLIALKNFILFLRHLDSNIL